jgi:hypothetical protein
MESKLTIIDKLEDIFNSSSDAQVRGAIKWLMWLGLFLHMDRENLILAIKKENIEITRQQFREDMYELVGANNGTNASTTNSRANRNNSSSLKQSLRKANKESPKERRS